MGRGEVNMKKEICIALCNAFFCFGVHSMETCQNASPASICRENRVCGYMCSENNKQFYEAQDYLKSKKGSFSVQALVKNKDIDLLMRTLAYCRMWIVKTNSDFLLWSDLKVPVDGSATTDTIWSNLSSLVKKVQSEYSIDLDSAERVALLTAFHLPMKSAMAELERLYKKGGVLDHQYTFEEALFVLNLCPQPERVFFVYSSFKKEICSFYTKCLLGSMAAVLKHRKQLDESFSFDLDPYNFTTEDDLIANNAIKLLREIKERTGYAKWLVDDESDVKKKQD